MGRLCAVTLMTRLSAAQEEMIDLRLAFVCPITPLGSASTAPFKDESREDRRN